MKNKYMDVNNMEIVKVFGVTVADLVKKIDATIDAIEEEKFGEWIGENLVKYLEGTYDPEEENLIW